MANDVFGIVGTTVVGAFHVEAVVAEGGFGVVYRAYHSGFRAKVALKCLKIPQYLSPAAVEKFEAQFQAEAELLFKLSASLQAVVRPLHVEAVVAPDGTLMPFLALEWLEGETLDAIAKRRAARREPPFSLGELITLLTPVARALERAHHFEGPDGPISIVHRDIKPDNLFVARVSGDQVVKILDFGIAKAKSLATQVAGRSSQHEGQGLGSFTPAYGAPEQWSPKRLGQTGPWTDVWGLALTMVELLAGRPVVDGDNAAMMGTVLDTARRPTPRAEGVRVGDSVEAVFGRALAVDPRDRYGDVGEFWNALLAAQEADRAAIRSGAPSPFLGSRPPASARSTAPVADAIPDLELAPASRSGRFPSTGPTARSGRFPASSSSNPPRSSSSPRVTPEPSSYPELGTLRNPRFDDDDEGETGLELESSPFSVSEADIPVAPSEQSSRPPAPRSTPPVSARPAAAPASGPPAVESSAPARAPTAPSRFSTIDEEPGIPEWVRKFAAPAAMLVIGIVITVVDGAYASANGEVFMLGPLRLAWVAAGLVIAGIGLSLYRLLDPDV
ncbi:MAG TPA: serine/threonine-protein kinase [Polyangiaceae bacterium]|nr:serine/threonine-protein kinase [Polyangiaceae bacterium]